MSDWEAPPSKPTNAMEAKARDFADIGNATADFSNPNISLAMLDEELARPNLHPVARTALVSERERLTNKATSWEAPPKSATWEAPPKDGSSFKSGKAFEDTIDLLSSTAFTASQIWEGVKSGLAHPPTGKEDAYHKKLTVEEMNKMGADEHAAGSGIIDLAAYPFAMAGGALHGAWDGVTSGDTVKGLGTANKTMQAMLPSSWAGNKQDQESSGYKALMAPLTPVMDTLNAFPTGYGEVLDAAGFPKAAAQVEAGGKLGVMGAAAFAGVKGAYKGLTGKEAKTAREAADKLEKMKAFLDAEKAKKAADEQAATAGAEPTTPPMALVPKAEDVVQTREEKQAAVRQQLDADNAPDRLPTYPLEQPPADPNAPLPYEMSLVPKGEEAPLPAGGREIIPTMEQWMTGDRGVQRLDREFTGSADHLQMPMVPDRLELVPRDGEGEAPSTPAFTPETPRPVLDGTEAKAREQVAYDAWWQKEEAEAAAERAAAHEKADGRKEVDYNKMEAQRELDLNNSLRNITERSTMRQAFLDKSNLDFKHLEENVKDTTLMDNGRTIEMRANLRNGNVKGALATLAENHPIAAYRELAKYLMDKVEGLTTKLHDESTIRMGDRDVTGYYDPQTHTVGLSGLGASSPHTVLHEIAHAVSSHFINTNPRDMRVTGLKTLFRTMANERGMREFPGIVNVKEFVAEAFSNPKFQEFLKGVNVNNKSVWRRFVDGVKSMLGLSGDTPMVNAFEHAMDLSKQVVEAQTGKSDVAGKLRDSGMSNKLADLMATKPEDVRPEVVENGNVQDVLQKLTGMEKIKEQFDFTPKPPEEVAQMAKAAKDIPASMIETLKANLDSGGLMASLRHNNNPIIKYTFAYVDQAVKAYEKSVRENITNKDTGIKSMLQKLSKEDFTQIHTLMMLDEGERVRTSTELAAMGFTEDMIAAHNRIREVDNKLLADINEARAQLNPPLAPIEPRIGHLAGRFVGDFSHMIFDEHGNAVMRVNGHTKWGAQKIADFIKQEHPEWRVDKQEYQTIKAAQNTDRFNGFRELMNYVGKNDPVVGKALDTLDKYNRSAATRFLDVQRHAKDKQAQPGGIVGSEGHKSWVDAQTNAEQGFKAQMAYLDNSYKWIEMQKAMENISKVTNDVDVIKQQPNAIKWATAYTDHALHRNQGFLADFAGSLLSEVGRVTGVGHTALKKGVNTMSSFEMRNWMGIGNIPFALKHMVLPLQKMPAMMAYLKTVGQAEGGLVAAGANSLGSYYKYLRNATDLSPFQKEAFKFAKENNVFNVDLADTSGKIQSSKLSRGLGKFSDLDFSAPEHAIRGTSFFFYAHLLEDSGMPVQSALSSAEHLSKFLYTDYAQHEAPRGAAKGGWIGQLALQITRYKANEIGQLGFFNRERISMSDTQHTSMQKVMSNAPLMVHIGSLLAFTGATGMLAYKEMDHIYSTWMKYMHGTPDNLTAVLQRSNAPDLVKYGLSSLIGIDSKISEADLLPSPFPTTAAEISQLGMAYNAVRYHDEISAKRLALSFTPSTARGFAENSMFTNPKEEDGPNAGKSLYTNPNTGRGRYARTDEQKNIRNFGFHTTSETDELQDNYSKERIVQDNADLADHIVTTAKNQLASGVSPQEVSDRFAEKYAKYQQVHQPDFSTALVNYITAQHLDQKTQLELGVTRDRMGNSLKIMMQEKGKK